MAEDDEGDPCTIVSLQDVLEEDQELESTANAVLGDSDDTKCSYSKGYVGRQALYACGTCVGPGSEPAGVCLACSLHCHDGHQLYELYTKRAFRCDCGNARFPGGFTCTLTPVKEAANSENRYNQNFRGLYCTCSRPYPDTEDEVEDEMIQCVVCEDWFHSRHLTGEAPSSYEEMACDSCMGPRPFLRFYQQETTPTTVTKEDGGEENGADSTSGSLDVVGVSLSGSDSGIGSGNSSESNSLDTTTTTTTTTGNGNNSGNTNDSSNVACELSRRKALLSSRGSCGAGGQKRTTAYFEKKWRSQLCKCPACKALYESGQCSFLLDESDSLHMYEERAQTHPSSHDAAMDALGSIDHVQQVEAIHHYTELKTELSSFFNNFAEKRKVVSKEDIEGFFEDMQKRKKRRLETGEGVPPANCHF